MEQILDMQMALDYCCTPEQAAGRENVFTVFSPLSGRRLYDGSDALRIAVYRGKLLCTGRAEVVQALQRSCSALSPEWSMDASFLSLLDRMLEAYGLHISSVHEFFVAAEKTDAQTKDLDICWYDRDTIRRFENDGRFGEAFAFRELTPDVLGVSASRNGRILGMAGASADSPFLWQIGVNTMEDARNAGIATALVTLLKNEILDRGHLPYYGTALSHLASQRVALRSGFLPAWTELLTESL